MHAKQEYFGSDMALKLVMRVTMHEVRGPTDRY